MLIDDGLTHNILNYTLVKKLKLPQVKSSHTYIVSLMNGDNKHVWDTKVKGVSLEIQGHTMTLDFHVMHMTRADVVLSRAWLHGLGDTLKRSYLSNTLAFTDNGVHVLLMGEKDIPSSPLVCSAEIDVLANNNEIKQAFLFTPCLYFTMVKLFMRWIVRVTSLLFLLLRNLHQPRILIRETLNSCNLMLIT